MTLLLSMVAALISTSPTLPVDQAMALGLWKTFLLIALAILVKTSLSSTALYRIKIWLPHKHDGSNVKIVPD